jgi:electron transfer flavoprotein alpha subunit
MESFTGFTPDESAGVIIEKIRELAGENGSVIVSGGRGIGSPDFFDRIKRLAELLSGEAGASRAVVDAGWAEKRYQIGQTGRRVSPDVYLAIGISGSVQHRVGIKDARHVIAVNQYPGAPIFEIAELGIIGDLTKIIPAMIEMLEKQVYC